MKTVIKNALALTMNGREVLKDAYILIDGSTIRYIGQEAPQQDGNTRVLDARGGIVMPAFVNMHTHLAMTYFRSYASDLRLDKWLEKIFAVEDRLDEEAMYYGALIACAEAMEHGACCVNDMYLDSFGTVRACADSGIRAYVSRCVVDSDGAAGLERRLRENEELFRNFDALDGRIYVLPSAHAEYTCSREALSRVYGEAKRLGRPVHIHISETNREVSECLERHGMTPLELLQSMGLLEDTRTIAAHCVAVGSRDIDIMKNSGVYPVHNPCSNLKLGSGVAPVKTMLEAGVGVCIGTDGNGSNNNIDMFRETFVASVLQKGFNRQADCTDAFSVFKMATANGAEALGYNGGVLKSGAAADIMILDKTPFLEPVHDPFGMVVYSGEAKRLKTLIVNGRVTVENGECVTVNKQEAYSGFIRCAKRLFEGID